jgi:hypothetical protein
MTTTKEAYNAKREELLKKYDPSHVILIEKLLVTVSIGLLMKLDTTDMLDMATSVSKPDFDKLKGDTSATQVDPNQTAFDLAPQNSCDCPVCRPMPPQEMWRNSVNGTLE